MKALDPPGALLQNAECRTASWETSEEHMLVPVISAVPSVDTQEMQCLSWE